MPSPKCLSTRALAMMRSVRSSMHTATTTFCPMRTGFPCSRNGSRRSFGSPQSRNAPARSLTSFTSMHANSPSMARGRSVVATRRSSESR